jgi:PAS domain S-box-containing protein
VSDKPEDIVGAKWHVLLQHLDDAVLVLDHDRSIVFVNSRARSLLGYSLGDEIRGRCRLTTQGTDCNEACPLTYALNNGLEVVEGFATMYRRRDGQPVSVEVTVIPCSDGHGGFSGAVEILKPTSPQPGFFLAGQSPLACQLRQRVIELARSDRHVLLVGEAVACADIARVLHRYSGLDETLFVSWPGSWQQVTTWPPGTAYAWGADAASMIADPPPEGWRVVAAVGQQKDLPEGVVVDLEPLALPDVGQLQSDLPLMIRRWIDQLAPHLAVEPQALGRLCTIAEALGLTGAEGIIGVAVASAEERLEERHIPVDCFEKALMGELLESSNPLVALEQRVLREVLTCCQWKMQEAADRLGISRVTLWRKLKDHGIERPDDGK